MFVASALGKELEMLGALSAQELTLEDMGGPPVVESVAAFGANVKSV